MRRLALVAIIAGLCHAILLSPRAQAEPGELRAGAWSVDASPTEFPVIVNGGFLAARSDRVLDPLKAKCLVLDNGETKLAIVVVDVCMMTRELIDGAKKIASEKTGIPIDRMLVSATHTHSAGSCMPALGTPADPAYTALLPGRVASVITEAAARLEPAEVGWAKVDDPKHTYNRRWIRKPDKMIEDPFGNRSARAHMHPGYVNPDAIAPSGPVDPALTVLSVRRKSGRPLAVLANYSMHYYGAQPVSADYYGRFSDRLAARIAGNQPDNAPVAMMSQGTSGDLMWMNYGAPKNDLGIDNYANEMVQIAFDAYKTIRYESRLPLVMAEDTLTLGRRLPDAKRLEWARSLVAQMGNREPKSLPEVYAKEAIYLHEEPKRELKLQAIRIGNLGITAIPDEVYAITGLKIKARSPLPITMNIELANGSEGYIPPPEQHALGGYTTWPARTAGLEVNAEPQIAEKVLTLLEKVAGQSRKQPEPLQSRYASAVLASKPAAFWRLDDLDGSTPSDSSGRGQAAAKLMPGFALYLPGAEGRGLSGSGTDRRVSRGVHLAGGRLESTIDSDGPSTIELWFWNGLPTDERDITGTLLSVGGFGINDVISIGGKKVPAEVGRLTLNANASTATVVGQSPIDLKTWNHLVIIRDGQARVTVHLNGNPKPEISFDRKTCDIRGSVPLLVGDRPGKGEITSASFEGKIDEVAVYDRMLKPEEIAAHYQAAVSLQP